MLTLQDVEANTTQLVDVWVVDLGQEANLGRSHGVVFWEEELELEDSACGDLSASYVLNGMR